MNKNTKDICKNILEIHNLQVEYRVGDEVVKAINGLDLFLEEGKTLGLVGETGAGKTTTGLSILRLVPNPPGVIVGGSIELDGEKILNKSEKQMTRIRGNTASMIFQDPMTSLNPVLSIEDQIAEVILEHENVKKEDAIDRARDMLNLVGIPKERGKEYPHQFSGGMRQRAVIAIALSCKPKLLIADEPTTALDVTIQAQVLELMKQLINQYGMSVLMITHDLGVVAEICDTVAVMYAGRIVEYGTLRDVYNYTRHPYTKGLFDSLPNIENKDIRLKPVTGVMPNPTNLPTGCPFHPRCNYAIEKCSCEIPNKLFRNENHYVTCHAYNAETVQKGGILK